MEKVYQDYIVKFRCLAFLEQQLEEYERVEHDRMEEQQMATKKILERMKQVHPLLEQYFESITTKDSTLESSIQVTLY